MLLLSAEFKPIYSIRDIDWVPEIATFAEDGKASFADCPEELLGARAAGTVYPGWPDDYNRQAIFPSKLKSS